MSSNTPARILGAIQGTGLTEIESKAYVALLEMGRGSADSVAHRAELKRASAYVALESLRTQGLVLKVPRARKMLFIAKDPGELHQRAVEKMKAVESIIPHLREMATGDRQFNTVLFEGLEGIKKAMWYKIDDMHDTTYRAFFGSAEQVSDELKTLLHAWNRLNAKKNIRARAIAPAHPSLREFRESDADTLREIKVVPYETYPSQDSIEIYDTFVRLVMFDELSAVIIESPTLARSLAAVHEMLWRAL